GCRHGRDVAAQWGEEVVHDLVDVLDARVGQEMDVGALDERERLLNNCCGRLSRDLLGKLPGEDVREKLSMTGCR
ncbi:MAG: hypothetical protein K0V04_02900, partial [Deltaproteobacteria bacterium]|nr:hypothetical protein [Deltaproteobacteria bacterium]